MARIKTKFDGEHTTFMLFQSPKEFWKNYHVPKHVILNNNNDNYYSVLKIETDEIEKIKSMQIDELDCNEILTLFKDNL